MEPGTAGAGGDAEETPCESEIRFQNRGQGTAARAGKLPPPPSPFAAPVPAFRPLGPSLPHSPAPSGKHEGHPRAPHHREVEQGPGLSWSQGRVVPSIPGETGVKLVPGTSEREMRAL